MKCSSNPTERRKNSIRTVRLSRSPGDSSKYRQRRSTGFEYDNQRYRALESRSCRYSTFKDASKIISSTIRLDSSLSVRILRDRGICQGVHCRGRLPRYSRVSLCFRMQCKNPSKTNAVTTVPCSTICIDECLHNSALACYCRWALAPGAERNGKNNTTSNFEPPDERWCLD